MMKLAPLGVPNYELLFQNGNSTQMSIVTREIGAEAMVVVLTVLIDDLVNYFNIGKPMNPTQISDLAVEMITVFKYHRFEDIPIFFEGIKKGKYGKIYDRLDGEVIWGFFNVYDEKRNDWITWDNTKDNNKDPAIKRDDVECFDKLYGFTDGINALKGRLGNIRDLNKGSNKKPE